MSQRCNTTTPSTQQNCPNRNCTPNNANATCSQAGANNGFTVFQPDQKKRASWIQGAQAEEKAYEEFKKANTIQSVHHVAALGGGATNNDVNQAREGFLARAAPSKAEKMEREAEKKAMEKAIEESKIQFYKDQQRQKSEKNEQAEIQRQIRLREQAEKQKEMFLKKFETKK